MSPPAQQTRRQRRRMVARQLVDRGIRQCRVLAAMAWVPREWFVPPHLAGDAYDDAPLPAVQVRVRPLAAGPACSDPGRA